MDKSLYEEPINNRMQPEASKAEKINAINEIWEFNDSEKTDALVGLAENYFTHYGIPMPHELWENELLNPLIYPESKTKVKETLSKIKTYAIKHHNQNTPIVKIVHDVTRFTLLKLLKRTMYGARLDEMGKYGSSIENVDNGFITIPVLDIIIEKVTSREKPTACMIKAFGSVEKINFIHSKLVELRNTYEEES